MAMRKPQIIIVDDEESVCRAMSRLIRSLGMDARAFTSSQEFVHVMESEPQIAADCVILDVQMPGLSGLQVQAALNLLKTPVPIIFITAHDDADVRERAMTAGAVALLRKPFGEEALIEQLEAAIGPLPHQK